MNKQIEIEAFYDSLSIGHKLDNFLDGFERQEIHLFFIFLRFSCIIMVIQLRNGNIGLVD